MSITQDLAELRHRIASGAYVVDSERVAWIIARKITAAERVRRALNLHQDGRSHSGDGYHRPDRAAPRRRSGSAHR
jgi:hypothetical protein